MESLQILKEIINLLGNPGNIQGSINDILISIAIITFSINIVQCFFGYKLIKFWISICGFFLFGIIGFALGMAFFREVGGGVVLGIIMGVIGAWISFALYKVGIFLITFSAGLVIGGVLFDSLPFGVVLGTVIGILAILLTKPVIIIATSIQAGILAGQSLAIILSADDGVGVILSIVLSITGIVVQWITNKDMLKNAEVNNKTTNVEDSTNNSNINTEAIAETLEKAKNNINQEFSKAKVILNQEVETAKDRLNQETLKAIASSKELSIFEILKEFKAIAYSNKITKYILFYAEIIMYLIIVLSFVGSFVTPLFVFDMFIILTFLNVSLLLKENYKTYIIGNTLNLSILLLCIIQYSMNLHIVFYLLISIILDYVGINLFLQTSKGKNIKEKIFNKFSDTSNSIATKVIKTKIVVRCPNCNNLCKESDKFCPNCGCELITSPNKDNVVNKSNFENNELINEESTTI